MTKHERTNRHRKHETNAMSANHRSQENQLDSAPPPEKAIEWRGWLCLLCGWIVPQLILIGPALVGIKVLVPFDLLNLPGVYLPERADQRSVHPFDPVLMDLILVDIPARDFCLQEYRQGRLPLWQSQNFLGAPFASWPKYSPFEIPYWIWPSLVTLAWSRLLQMLCIGVGGWVFLRNAVGLSYWPAAIGSWCFPMIGFVTLWQGFPLIGSVVWLPWVLATVDVTVRRPERWGAVGLTIVTSLVLLSGQPDVGGLTLLLSGFYAVSRMIAGYGRHWSSWMNGGLALSLAWFLGILLASPYWMPLIDYARTGVRLQERMAGVEERPPAGWTAVMQVICPEHQGNTRRGSIYFGSSGNLLESSAGAFAGLIAALWLAPLALCDVARRSQTWFWIAIVVFGLAWPLGIPLIVDLMRLPPLNSLSYNRAVLMTAVSTVILASIGLEHVLHSKLKFHSWQLVPFGLIIALGLLFGSSALDLPAIVQTDLPNAVRNGYETKLTMQDVGDIQQNFRICYAASAVLCFVAGTGWLWTFWGGPFRQPVVSFTVAMMLGELIVFSLCESRLRDGQFDYPRIAALEKLASLPAGRAWGIRCLPPNLNRTHGISDVRGYDAVDPKSIVELLRIASDPRFQSPKYAITRNMVPAAYEIQNKTAVHPIVNLLNIRYFISRSPQQWSFPVVVQDADYWITENKGALQRAFIPLSVERVSAEDVVSRMDQIDFDPSRLAFVTDNLDLPLECRGEVALQDLSPTELELQLDLETDCLVVVSDMWDPDWKATVDNSSAEIVRTNSALRGIRVSSGKHTIRMRYQPASVQRGIFASIFALSVVIVWTLRMLLQKSHG